MSIQDLEATPEQKKSVIEHFAILMAPHLGQGDIELDDRNAVVERLVIVGYSLHTAEAAAARAVEIAKTYPWGEYPGAFRAIPQITTSVQSV